MDARVARIGYLAGLAAIALLSTFGLILLALHMLAARHGGVPAYLSHFRLLPHAWLWDVGLVLLAVGAAALAVALHIALPPGPWTRAALTFIYPLSPMAVALAVFPAAAPGAPTYLPGRIHEGVAIAMFLCVGTGMLCLFATLRDWTPLVAWTSLAVGVAFFAMTPWVLDGFINASHDVAYGERLLVLLKGAWLLMLGVWSRFETAPFAKRPRTQPGQPTRTTARTTD